MAASNPSPAPIRFGVWSNASDTFLLDDLLSRMPERYEVHRFRPVDSVDALRAMLADIDMVWFESETARLGSQVCADIPAMCRLERHEAYGDLPKHIAWPNLDRLVLPAEGVKESFAHIHKGVLTEHTLMSVVPNAVDMEEITFDPEKTRNHNLAFVGDLNYLNNPMLLLQILHKLVALDNRYVLHITGDVKDYEVGQYLHYHVQHMGLTDHIFFYGTINHDDLYPWLSQSSYCLTSSVIEGHPIGVMEAMALGLKPIIHDFVGARHLFPKEYLFNAVDDAVAMIHEGSFKPEQYHRYIARNYTMDQQLATMVQLVDRLACDYYPERMLEHFRRERAEAAVAPESAEDRLREAHTFLADGNLDAAAAALEQVPFDALQEADILPARALALQLAINRQKYTDALFHADAALDLAPNEPLIHNLMGQGLWEKGHELGAVEALVHAAELLQQAQDLGLDLQLPVNEAEVYYLGGEACMRVNHTEGARMFYQRAAQHAPGDPTIATALAQVSPPSLAFA